jgi:hypothetical protein
LTDPTKDDGNEDLNTARHREILDRLQNNREKSAQEHGAIVTVVNEQNRETRAHIASEVGAVSKEMRFFKNFQERMLKAMKRFLNRHGIGSDDI